MLLFYYLFFVFSLSSLSFHFTFSLIFSPSNGYFFFSLFIKINRLHNFFSSFSILFYWSFSFSFLLSFSSTIHTLLILPSLTFFSFLLSSTLFFIFSICINPRYRRGVFECHASYSGKTPWSVTQHPMSGQPRQISYPRSWKQPE